MQNLSAQASSPEGTLSPTAIRETLQKGLGGQFKGQRVLVLVPDHTRSLPLPHLFRRMVELLQDARRLDFMVALGTHPRLSDTNLNQLFGITADERATVFRQIHLLNHAWDDPSALVSLGVMSQDEIRRLAGERWHPSLGGDVDIRINKAVFAYDQILILGPTFPHEVAGFSGGAKYLFPGISGPEMIHVTHWLGALSGVVGTIGIKDTPTRAMIHAAASRLSKPITLIGLVVVEEGLAGIFIGDHLTAWNAAADLSAKRHIRWCDRAYRRVLSCAPPMYDEMWTAAKAMYKLEPAVETGGEVVIYAPHLDTVSRVHGKYIYEVGYHILPYILEHWETLKHIPLGVLAHSTHVRGSGHMENGEEKPNVRVTLASRIPPEDCEKLNLGYLDPGKVHPEEWQNREKDGCLFVPKAGEILYRVKGMSGA